MKIITHNSQALYNNTTSKVYKVDASIDSNIQAGNIKQGVTILGVEGTYGGGITPTGTINITENGTHDVTNYASASVNVPDSRNEFGNTGHIDRVGLAALGWNTNDMDWLQSVCWWDEEDDAEWSVTQANITKGALITWDNYTDYITDADIRFFPKLGTPSGTSMQTKFDTWDNVYAIPTDGWNLSSVTNYRQCFNSCKRLVSIGDFIKEITYTGTVGFSYGLANGCYSLRKIGTFGSMTISNALNFFNYCQSIKEIKGLHNVASSISSWASAFRNCYDLETFDCPPIPDGVTLTYWLMSSNKVKNIPHSGLISSTVSFSECPLLTRESVLVLFNALDTTASGKTITLNALTKELFTQAELDEWAAQTGWTIA